MLLSNSNSKLRPDSIYSFGLPPVKTCPFAGACKSFCYAQNGFYRMTNVTSAHQKRLEATKRPDFVQVMVDEISRRLVKRIRIHDSGDFYSLTYLKRWIAIANALPEVSFYAYSKSIPLFRKVTLPKNFRVIFSAGGTKDHEIDTRRDFHALIFKTQRELDASGYVDGSNSDLVAAAGKARKIGLLLH